MNVKFEIEIDGNKYEIKNMPIDDAKKLMSIIDCCDINTRNESKLGAFGFATQIGR